MLLVLFFVFCRMDSLYTVLKRFWIWSIHLFFPTGLLFTSFFALSALPDPQIEYDISSLQSSVYKITNSGYDRGDGTAFAIGPNLFITNYHVIKDLAIDPKTRSSCCIYDSFVFRFVANNQPLITLSNINGETLTFDKLIRIGDEHIELALFTTKESVSSYLTIESDHKRPKGNLLSLGFPKGDFRISHFSKINNFKNRWSKKTYYSILFNATDFDNLYHVAGLSGGPLFNKSERVVAVIFGGNKGKKDDFSDSSILAVKSKDLQDFIDGKIGFDDSNLIEASLCRSSFQ